MAEPSREDYLATLDDLLPFPPERRAEITEEIGAHFDDAMAAELLRDQTYRDPATTAPLIRRDGGFAATLSTNIPGLSSWEAIVTARGPDGRRYVLDSGTIMGVGFEGSVWDWIVAVSRESRSS